MSGITRRDALTEASAAHRRRWEAVETAKTAELAAMTDERARAIIMSIEAVGAWRARPDWSGLVDQQAIFRRAHRG